MNHMDRIKFIEQIEKIYKDGVELIKKKNADYADDTDPFRNFRNADIVGISPEKAILIRILDKITRIANLLNRQGLVRDEKMEDSILDAINYLAILKVFLENKTYANKIY